MSQYQWTYNGWTFGESTAVDVVGVDGLGLPDIEDADLPLASSDGAQAGLDFYSGRTIRFDLELVAASDAALETLQDTIRRATVKQSVDLPLTLQLAGQAAKRIDCRPAGRRTKVDNRYSLGSPITELEFRAVDPFFYLGTADTVPIAASATGSLPNDGDSATWFTATIAGPATNPKLLHVASGLYLDFSDNGGLVVPGGQSLVIDSRKRTSILNSSTNAYGYLTPLSEFFTLDPGANSVTYTITAGSGAASLVYRDAWASVA